MHKRHALTFPCAHTYDCRALCILPLSCAPALCVVQICYDVHINTLYLNINLHLSGICAQALTVTRCDFFVKTATAVFASHGSRTLSMFHVHLLILLMQIYIHVCSFKRLRLNWFAKDLKDKALSRLALEENFQMFVLDLLIPYTAFKCAVQKF